MVLRIIPWLSERRFARVVCVRRPRRHLRFAPVDCVFECVFVCTLVPAERVPKVYIYVTRCCLVGVGGTCEYGVYGAIHHRERCVVFGFVYACLVLGVSGEWCIYRGTYVIQGCVSFVWCSVCVCVIPQVDRFGFWFENSRARSTTVSHSSHILVSFESVTGGVSLARC